MQSKSKSLRENCSRLGNSSGEICLILTPLPKCLFQLMMKMETMLGRPLAVLTFLCRPGEWGAVSRVPRKKTFWGLLSQHKGQGCSLFGEDMQIKQNYCSYRETQICTAWVYTGNTLVSTWLNNCATYSSLGVVQQMGTRPSRVIQGEMLLVQTRAASEELLGIAKCKVSLSPLITWRFSV